MEKKTVIVTGIGGNVGQGIVRNLRFSGLPLHIIGTNVLPFSPGNHLVDAFYQVPYAYDPGFISVMQEIMLKEKVDLTIPSTDYEVYFMSHATHNLPGKLATAGPLAAETYLDKYLTWQHHSKLNIPFAKSLLPSFYNNDFEKAIAKPRKGRGSRGLLKLKFDTGLLSDDEYMIQEMHEGKEITTAVYTSYLTGKILGLLTMERSLENGTTTFCKVNFDYDKPLMEIAQKMVDNSDLRGSFNIQSIVNETGEIVPFEINCRISGTNSIRTHFGFKDVEYTVRELLLQEKIAPPKVIPGVAQRILMDVIYPDCKVESELHKDNTDKFLIF
jgi:carbamoyl-phosphate synthase large subunit